MNYCIHVRAAAGIPGNGLNMPKRLMRSMDMRLWHTKQILICKTNIYLSFTALDVQNVEDIGILEKNLIGKKSRVVQNTHVYGVAVIMKRSINI